MVLRDDDRPIRLRPRAPRIARREGAAWAGAYRLLMHYASGMRKVSTGPHTGGFSRRKPYQQRCAVRVTYLNNRTHGQWKAHGRYLARESASDGKSDEAGFNRDSSGLDVTSELQRWQLSRDPRLWKVILSPEFGDRIDLRQLTRDLMDHMAADLGTDLEWIAVTHYNTEHPHVHVAIRGARSDGNPLQLRREYVKHGLRELVEDLCTRQIGYRTVHDAAEAERKEIAEYRFTSLDRAILSDADRVPPELGSDTFRIEKHPSADGSPDPVRRHARHIVARLAVLERMGIAVATGPNSWCVRRDLEGVLRAMQRTTDRQRTLAAHGVPISDDRLPIQVLDIDRFTDVEGRVLVHGQDEQTGCSYLMLEGVDAKIHFVQYTAEIERLRADGGLRTNSFLRLRGVSANGKLVLQVQDLGDAETAIRNRSLLGVKARSLLESGIVPTVDGWGGWLGRYQAALAGEANEILHGRGHSAHMPDRRRDRSRGR